MVYIYIYIDTYWYFLYRMIGGAGKIKEEKNNQKKKITKNTKKKTEIKVHRSL